MAMGGFMGRFRTSPDTLVPHSSVGAVAMISVNLSALGAVMGKVYSPSGSFMFEYMLRFDNSPRRFWGIGYEAAEPDLISCTGAFSDLRPVRLSDMIFMMLWISHLRSLLTVIRYEPIILRRV